MERTIAETQVRFFEGQMEVGGIAYMRVISSK